jgi:ABC-type bacteriocin/lantibiotic exporter with double-glycine peptidase domain
MSNRIDLGQLISSHGTSPVFLQRAVIIAVLSFLFFIITLLFFYINQELMYFVMSTAFLVIYILTMTGWVMQKRNVVSIYENGIAYRKFRATWDEIASVKAEAQSGITIAKPNGESITIGKSIAGVNEIASTIRRHLR